MLKLAHTKKLFFTTVVLFTINLSCLFGQTHKFEVCIEGGPNVSFPVIINPPFDFAKTAGFRFLVGIDLQYNFNEFLAINTGILFERRNYEVDYPYASPSLNRPQSHTWSLSPDYYEDHSYITIPVLVNLGTNVNKSFIYACLGPYAGFKILSAYPSDHKQVGNFDAGIILGFGTSIPLNKAISLEIEPRCSMGLLNNERYLEYSVDGVVSLVIGVTYKFGEKKAK